MGTRLIPERFLAVATLGEIHRCNLSKNMLRGKCAYVVIESVCDQENVLALVIIVVSP